MPMVTLVLGWPRFLKDRGAPSMGHFQMWLMCHGSSHRGGTSVSPVPCPLFQGSQDGPSFQVIFFSLEY